MKATPQDILKRYRSPDTPHVYFLGTQERRLAIVDQQVRAFNLAYAIAQEHNKTRMCTVGIIGAGIGGLTLAAACLLAGCKVCLFESADRLVPIQDNSRRMVYPNILEWPSRNSLATNTDLPWMNWGAGPAGAVRTGLVAQYRILAGSAKFRQRCVGFDRDRGFCRAEVQQVKHAHGGRLSVIHSTERESRSDSHPPLDVVVICTGFGKEEPLGRVVVSSPSYWDSERVVADYLADPVKVLVSGAGDGALIEAVTLATGCESAAAIVSSMWPRGIPPAHLARKLTQLDDTWKQRIDSGQKNKDAEASEIANSLYESLPKDCVPLDAFQAAVVTRRAVDLISPLAFPYTIKASPLSRLLIYMAVRTKCIHYESVQRGALSKRGAVSRRESGFVVAFGKGQKPMRYSHLIVRHGPRAWRDRLNPCLGCARPMPGDALDFVTPQWTGDVFKVPRELKAEYRAMTVHTSSPLRAPLTPTILSRRPK